MSDSFSKLDPATLARAARAAFEGVIVVFVALQSAAIGALLAAFPLLALEFGRSAPSSGLKDVLPLVTGVVGAVGGTFVAGWWVLGGWRGGLRAVGIVLMAGAAVAGTYGSPILAERLRPAELTIAATIAGFGAAAVGGVALAVIAPRVARGPAPASPGPAPLDDPRPGASDLPAS